MLLKFNIRVDCELRENSDGTQYWAATANPFFSTTYGETREEAEQSLYEAVTALVASMSNQAACEEYFVKNGIPYAWTEPGKPGRLGSSRDTLVNINP